MKRYEKKLIEKKATPFQDKLIKLRNEAYKNLYELNITLQKGYTGGVDKENDKAIRGLQDWSRKLLEKDFNFPSFMKTLEKITINVKV